MEHLFDFKSDRPGYRLHRLEVFNWGTFDSTDGRIHRFEAQGRTSLLVGDNGAGKSTLVDAILTLFVESRTRNYNVAAGAKKTERTVKTYIKGAFKRTTDENESSIVRYLRPKGDHLTALMGVFCDEDAGRAFTLMQVLWLKTDGSDDKVYAIADEERELKADLAGLTTASEVRDHLKKLGYHTAKTYNEYFDWLVKRTGMRRKAMDMFNQTVHVKDIQSLNTFIRQHMLEVQDWHEKVQRVLAHFNDLSLAHQELVRARKAEELLAPVASFGEKYRQQSVELQRMERQLDAASTYFPVHAIELFAADIDRQETAVSAMIAAIARMDRELKDKREAIRQLNNEIEMAGGERLKKIPGLIEVETAHLQRKQDTYKRFHEYLKVCRIKGEAKNAAYFAEARQHLATKARLATEQLAAHRGKYEDAIGRRSALDAQIRDERAELEVLQQRRTNLPPRFTAMRSRICADLSLDEESLPFAAELMAVAPEHRRWEASAELVLHSFALSLLVPERYYRRVRTYVETHRIIDGQGEGQKLDYICVGKPSDAGGDRIDARSLVHKLQFKPRHDLSPWVRGEILKRFDFRCCESVEEFSEYSRFAMTDQRHVKFGPERHQKDDRPRAVDPRYFVLGWDNTEKKRRIAERIGSLERDRAEADTSVREFGAQVAQCENICRAATAALEVADFDAIDVKKHENEIAALTAEQNEIENANVAIRTLRKRLNAATNDESKLSQERDEAVGKKARCAEDIKRSQLVVDNARKEVQAARESGRLSEHEPYFSEITSSLGEPALTTGNFWARREQWTGSTSNRVRQLREPLQKLSEALISRMAAYLKEFRDQSADLDATVDSLDTFLGLLERLRREDLPKHERKFKDHLNDNVSQEIALFNTELRQEGKRIEDRISELNRALAGVEYSRGTLMRLEPRPVQDREIEEFRRAVRECLDQSLEHSDAANEARFTRIEALVKRLADPEKTTWRSKVIDVRNWYDFTAREIDRDTQAVRSCYDGSSGQSGGEKAKLAFTILVAAIAYQFDVDPSGKTPERFHFVVVDEMLSKTDEQNARYALKLFRQFGLQILIVAPLDAKARVTEPFVDRYLHSVKDPLTNHSQLYSMTAQEYEDVVKQFSAGGSRPSRNRVTAK